MDDEDKQPPPKNKTRSKKLVILSVKKETLPEKKPPNLDTAFFCIPLSLELQKGFSLSKSKS